MAHITMFLRALVGRVMIESTQESIVMFAVGNKVKINIIYPATIISVLQLLI